MRVFLDEIERSLAQNARSRVERLLNQLALLLISYVHHLTFRFFRRLRL